MAIPMVNFTFTCLLLRQHQDYDLYKIIFITLKKKEVWKKADPNGMNLCWEKRFNKDRDKWSLLQVDSVAVISGQLSVVVHHCQFPNSQ
jgi:hypothetical protein